MSSKDPRLTILSFMILAAAWTAAVGSAQEPAVEAAGAVTDDFDGDGLLDIVTSSRDPCEPLRLYLNRDRSDGPGGADGRVTFAAPG